MKNYYILLGIILALNWIAGFLGFRKVFRILEIPESLGMLPIVRTLKLADLWIDGDEYWAVGFRFPSIIIRFGVVIVVGLYLIPYVGLVVGTLFSVVLITPLYINVFADLDDDSDFAEFLTGVICGAFPIFGYLKMMRYEEEDFI